MDEAPEEWKEYWKMVGKRDYWKHEYDSIDNAYTLLDKECRFYKVLCCALIGVIIILGGLFIWS